MQRTSTRALLALALLPSCVDEGAPSRETLPIQASVADAKKADRPQCPIAAAVNKDLILTKACSPYIQPSGGVDIVDGATLTIEAGVELRFNPNDWLEVGAGGKPGRLIAKGTPEEPIILTSSGPSWLGLWFHSGTLEGSVLSHVVVRNAGGINPLPNPDLPLGCITLTGVKSGALTLGDVRMEKCKNGGLRMTESHVVLGALSFSDMDEGLDVDPPSLGQITQAAQYSGVSRNVIRGGTVRADSTWVDQPVPYLVEGTINVGGPSAPKLVLGPGIELRFASASGLTVGAEHPGSIVAEGTREQPIKFTASEPGKTWSGIQLLRQTARGARLSFVEIDAAEGEAALAVHSEPGFVEVRDARFSGNSRDVLVGCGSKPILAKNSYGSGNGLSQQKPCN